jgi:hypothetical protein
MNNYEVDVRINGTVYVSAESRQDAADKVHEMDLRDLFDMNDLEIESVRKE